MERRLDLGRDGERDGRRPITAEIEPARTMKNTRERVPFVARERGERVVATS